MFDNIRRGKERARRAAVESKVKAAKQGSDSEAMGEGERGGGAE